MLGNVKRDFDGIGIYGGFERSGVMAEEHQKLAGTGTEISFSGSFLLWLRGGQ